jgi:hypothetical protein
MDGALPLLLAWQMEAKEMAKITKEEWVKGTSNVKCVDVAPPKPFPVADSNGKNCVPWCSFNSPQRFGETLGLGPATSEEISQTRARPLRQDSVLPVRQ